MMARAGRASELAGSREPSETRQALLDAAITALREDGFAGASARSIARRAGCNQGLVFYHFGSVANLLLAALDEVSRVRLEKYSEAVQTVGSLPELLAVAKSIFIEDLDAGHMTVLAQMIAGAASTPGLGEQIAQRLAPWRTFAAQAIDDTLSTTPFKGLMRSGALAEAVVALYLGLEMLAHLDGDRRPALELFDRAGLLVSALATMGGIGQ